MAEEEPNEEVEADAEVAPKSKMKLIIIIAVAVLALGLIGGGAYFFLSSAEEPEAVDQTLDEETLTTPDGQAAETDEEGKILSEETAPKEEEEYKVDIGETYTLDPFQLNLGNPLENHFVSMKVAIEYRGGETHKTEIGQRMAQIRDAVGTVVSRKTREFLLSPDGKIQLRKEILISLNRFMTKPVQAIYISDMLIE